ncbi:CmpA/NrtA family ABC transporter substrate-binding protein [Picosynechococcus sp. PCC 73109]|uniref:CmpA/NrtA family ABC transporter substrate-binding protein n=1 Tax=Picosynechococcus sp. PCC 73109 TaxID=374982 RepID=UPI0007458542|nr:CmpA/NrtA family ABC transporter substrate-binding protein [Picosynechococcus sp. PCC 73109]AMA10839.1 twin-arginine translocation pathway signal protein [Picosynechococcus sp. PCC 73109]
MNKISRRSFVFGMGATASALVYGACTAPTDKKIQGRLPHALAVEPLVRPESLEKPNLTVGFVPVNDCAPLAIAYRKGFFQKYGLNVQLSREASWANARDGLIFGRLDASPVVSGAVTNARIGAEGARAFPLVAAMTLHRHGNALTMNRQLWEAGMRPWPDYQGDLAKFGRDLRSFWQKSPLDDRAWGIPLSSSIYEYFARYLVAAIGLDPMRELRLVITPPPQMVSNMRIGAMQAYMVAEPWNTRAIAKNEGIGFTFIQGRDVWRGHPDRVLAVAESFIEQYPKTYRSLVKALIEACQYCGDPSHRQEVASIIAERAFTGANVNYTRPAIVGDYDYGGFDAQQRLESSLDTTTFFELHPETSTIPHDHSTFLWQSQGIWLMTQAARWGQIETLPTDLEAIAKRAWRTDLYRNIAAEMGITSPSEDYKVEPATAFIDQKAFDPSDPVGYLNSFELRANRPQIYPVS